MLHVTCDPSANLKLLRQLETAGLVQLWAVKIETIRDTRRLSDERKQPPIAVWDNPHSRWDEAVCAQADTPYKELSQIIGRHHNADLLHFENHVQNNRDVFATSDNDFLQHRKKLEDRFHTRVMTAEELEEHLRQLDNG